MLHCAALHGVRTPLDIQAMPICIVSRCRTEEPGNNWAYSSYHPAFCNDHNKNSINDADDKDESHYFMTTA